ncbi:MAG: hypothetical protein RI897_1432 [Verrucomicrobiota bacterium]
MVAAFGAEGLAGPAGGIGWFSVFVAPEDGAGACMWGEGFGVAGGPVIEFCEDEGCF